MLKRTLLERLYYAHFHTGIATRNAVSRWHGIGVFPAVREADYEGKENYCESKIISKTDLREVQGY